MIRSVWNGTHFLFAVLFIGSGLGSPPLIADCISLIKGPITLDVSSDGKSCGRFNPEATFQKGESEKTRFIKDLPPNARKQFFDKYRGLIVKGLVVQSEAVKTGLTPEKGALKGDRISAFIPPGSGSCDQLVGKRVKAELEEACCSGGGEVPCLLSSQYVLRSISVIGKASSGAGDAARVKAEGSKVYKEAEKYAEQGDCKRAIPLYEKARANGEVDIKGTLNLAQCYRAQDQCPKVLDLLKPVWERVSNKDLWADQEEAQRRAIFLLARCYARLLNPELAVVILESYLTDPKKYRKEIAESLSHKDFAWINTSKKYEAYRKEAGKALGTMAR